MTDRDADANQLSKLALAAGDPTGWFEPLYARAARGEATVPWDRGTPNPLLVNWFASGDRGTGTAIVVGCGLGRDSEYLATRGYTTTAFDLSPTAVDGARSRHPDSSVRYEVADLLALPARYAGAFDLVVESYTVQSVPDPPRARAIANVGGLVAAGGTLLVLAAGRTDDDPEPDGPPWPLTRAEIDAFAVDVAPVRIEDLVDDVGVHRWRAEFVRS